LTRALPTEGPVDFKHHHGALKDDAASVFPSEGSALLLGTMFLALDEVSELTPIVEKGFEKCTGGCAETDLRANVVQDGADAGYVFRPVGGY